MQFYYTQSIYIFWKFDNDLSSIIGNMNPFKCAH